MTRRQLLENTDARELADWELLRARGHFDGDRAELNMGILAREMNLLHGQGGQSVSAAQFMPSMRKHNERREREGMTAEEVIAKLSSAPACFGVTVEKG